MPNRSDDATWISAREALDLLTPRFGAEAAKSKLLRRCSQGGMLARAYVLSTPAHPHAGLLHEAATGDDVELQKAFWQRHPWKIDWVTGHGMYEDHFGRIDLEDLRFAGELVRALAGPASGSNQAVPAEPKVTRPVGQHAQAAVRAARRLMAMDRNTVLRMKATQIAEYLRDEYEAIGERVPGKRNLEKLASGLRDGLFDEIETD